MNLQHFGYPLEMTQETPCCKPETSLFALIGFALVFGSILASFFIKS